MFEETDDIDLPLDDDDNEVCNYINIGNYLPCLI